MRLNLPELVQLAHVVSEVQLYRTFSNYLVTWETRCAGCLGTSLEWFKHSEPPQTFSNHSSTEKARCGECCHKLSGWLACTEVR